MEERRTTTKKAAPRANTSEPRKAAKTAAQKSAAQQSVAPGPEVRTPTAAALKAAAKAAQPTPATRTRKTKANAPTANTHPADTQVLDDPLLEHLDDVLATLDTVRGETPQGTVRLASPSSAGAPLWARLVADPGYAAEHLAREAVRRIGPDARDWADRMRERYPLATPDGLARLASDELIRTARRQGAGALFGGAAGSLTAQALLARTQARVVLTVAAAYGLDPTADVRSRDILELLRVPRLTQPTVAAALNGGRLLAGVAVRRLAARLVPFGAGVAGALHSGRATEEVARRAQQRFRKRSETRQTNDTSEE